MRTKGSAVCRGDWGSRASSQAEDALLRKASLTDCVPEGDIRPVAKAASDVVRRAVELFGQAFFAVIAAMRREKLPDRQIVRHDYSPRRTTSTR